MAMGEQKDRQGDLMVSWSEMPRSPGHVFYDRLQSVLVEADFDGFVETSCKPYYAARMGAPSVPPGRYFRMDPLALAPRDPSGSFRLGSGTDRRGGAHQGRADRR